MARNEGFTLIEVLIALVILAIGLAGLVPAVVGSFRGNRFGVTTTRTATFSQDKLEELRRLDFGEWGGGTPTGLLASCGSAQTDTPATGVTRRWTVTEAGGGACDTAQLLVIEVCSAEGAVFNSVCVSAPMPSAHFLAVRANF